MFDINEIKKNVSNKFNKVTEDTNEPTNKPVNETTSIKQHLKVLKIASIGPSYTLKGNITGEEGLLIDGKIEGTMI